MVMKMVEELQGAGKDGEVDADDEVDLYDDVLSLPVGMEDLDDQDELAIAPSPGSSTTTNNIGRVNSSNANHNNLNDGRNKGDHHEYKDASGPQRKYQVCVGNLTWWTSDRDLEEAMTEIGVKDFVEVKFYDNRANGQSKGYCILTVGSDASVKLIHEKLSKKELHSQFPVVTHPTKQNLNQFESQAKSRPSPSGGQGMGQGMGGGRSGGGGDYGPGPGNMGMGMMGPRGPPQMMQGQMGMGYGGPGPGPRMMMGPNGPGPMHGPRGMPPMGPMGPMHGPGMMGPQHHGGPPPGPPGYGPPQQPRQGPPQNMMQPGGPGPKMPVMMHGGPGSGPMMRGPPPEMMDPRGPPIRHEWDRPPMNNYPPHGQGPMSMPIPRPQDVRSQGPPQPQQMAGGPPLQPAPAPHMNPAFFGSPPGVGPPGAFNSPEPPLVGSYLPPTMSEKEFDEVMSRNRTVSSSAISRAVSDAATGDFSSAIETLVTAISLIKQSKVAHDDRCKILVGSLQDTLSGIEGKHYASGGGGSRRDRSRSRSRDRHRRSRRDRSRSRESYRDRSRDRDRDRYYDYPPEESRVREARDREYRERPPREERSSAYYDERYREREREKERVPRPDRDLERERESARESIHRAPRH